jgi:hypothetical protein
MNEIINTRYGYGYVTEKGFIAFAHDISEGPWADVAVEGNELRTLGSDPMEIPRPVAWKTRVVWAIAALRDALGASPEVLAVLDVGWDGTQRKLFHAIGGALEDDDPAVRNAAMRLKGALLSGNGTAQTSLSYDDEVDFGRHQVELMTNGALAEDTKRIGLTGLRDRIDETTEALARGIGRGPGEKRTMARSKRIRTARAVCASDFNGIHSELAWLIAHTQPGPARTRIEQMLAPFQALLERYPAPAGAPAPVEAPPPAPTVEEPSPTPA